MEESKTFLQRFSEVQNALKVSKGRLNKFGGYKYRSCEDILKAAKPLLYKSGLVLTITDEVFELCGRYYVQATARVSDAAEGSDYMECKACAREPESKKGMDDSQITGTSSSYARKYALNGLFCLDDVQDADDFTGDEEPGLRCSKCGNDIKSHRAAMPGGANYSAAAVARMTKEKFGSELCWDCAAKLKSSKKKGV